MQNFLQWCNLYAHGLHEEIRDKLHPGDFIALVQVVDMYAQDYIKEHNQTLKPAENNDLLRY